MRSGKCNRCGECCPGCPHLIKGDIFTCAIWDKLSDKDDPEALKAGIHSSKCKSYPNSPIDLTIAKECGFKYG
jgi:hypothetical protein